ncbi:MAG TPA: phenylacetate--CoA ligase [Spirochaetota bacterium]|nr:phenylacetate--CoA ligase [Spirochaetota bacterium]HNT09778.1 phenylacetate--CoA ligase [Spirochaetota bacterium]HNV48588.1 phenylacetate--CoA ligase [Spirochaetota bacterium]HOS40828.1 phenylacetate--CoA ligase [Spirochaetota bacterium]HPU88095.1 phenylacetate--CoA ligase [Spirochaetota bacterium]
MYWNQDLETIDRPALERLQLSRLRAALERSVRAPFYRTFFETHRVDIDTITTLEHLRDLPFTTKADLRTSYPDGMMAVPRRDVVRLHASSGTTGKSTVIFYTQKDISEWADLIARSMVATGATPDDVFQNMMGYGLFTGGLGLHYGAERLGCLVIPSSSGNSLKQLQLMQDFQATIMHITPSYALHLVEIIKENGVDPHDLTVKKAYLGAEPYTEATRKKLEELWGMDAYNSYGLSEMNGPGVSFECVHKNGMHVWEDFYIIEIIDPDTGAVLPDGAEGELVLTHVNREAMPMFRYRTRDLTRIIPEPCPCGRTHRRIERIKGRTDDMFIIGGVNIFPSQIEAVLMAIPEVGNNYQIVLERDGSLDKVHVKVELYSKMFHGDMKELQTLRKKITEIVRSTIIVNPVIELMEPGSLPPSQGKAVRVIDNREQR